MVRRSPDNEARLVVRKRDGRQVPFDPERLLQSMQRALAATGRFEPSLAADLRGVIETYLADQARQNHAGRVGLVTADAIAELAQEVLRGAGCEPAAQVYRAARDERARARGLLRIRATAAHDPVRAIPPGLLGGPSGAGDASDEDADTGGVVAPAREFRGGGDVRCEDSEAWSKGRVAALLAQATDLAPGVVDAVAAEVERGLFASGLRSIGAALLREWVDNELVLRGHPPRLGKHRFVGLAPHELRGILADGAAVRSAETEVSRRLFTRYALAEVFPSDACRAHEQGLIGLENLGSCGRLDSVTLAPWHAPAFAGVADPRERLAALGPQLRTLANLLSREVLLDWDGPALGSLALSDLLLHLAEVAPVHAGGARIVFCIRPEHAGSAEAFLDALSILRRGTLPRPALLPCVRLPVAALSADLLAQAVAAEAVDDRLQFAATAPPHGVVSASVAVNVARLALGCGPRRVHEFLAGLEAATDLALGALAAQDALMGDGDAPAQLLLRATGLSAAQLPRRRRLALAGVNEAAQLLLGDGPRGRANRIDLAAAIGERLRRRLTDREPLVRLGRATRASCDRFGRLDLQAFPGGRELLKLTADRDGYRYDAAQGLAPGADGAEAGREAGRFWQCLGLDTEVFVPRCTGGTNQRLAYLPAFHSVTNPVPDLNPCG